MEANTDHLTQLEKLFTEAEEAYRQYLNDGKKFRHTIPLREVNERIHKLIFEIRLHLKSETQEAADALIAHYRSWMDLWDKHHEQIQPGPDDIFAFQTEVPFPRDAKDTLLARGN